MNEAEQTDLDAFREIFKQFPDLMKGNIKRRFDNLVAKQMHEAMEEQEKLMSSITSELSKQICAEIDAQIIKDLMEISVETASGPALKNLEKLLGLDPNPQIVEDFGTFVDNEIKLLGDVNGPHSTPTYFTTYQLGCCGSRSILNLSS